MENFLFYSGNGNHALGANILEHLKKYLSDYNQDFGHIDFNEFPNPGKTSENDDQIAKFAKIKGHPVVFYQSNYTDQLWLELQELVYGIKVLGATYIILVMPFTIFRRQDHDERPEEICRLRMLILMLKSIGVNEIVTISPHSPKMKQFCDEFGIIFREANPAPALASTLKTYITALNLKPVAYAPDHGSIIRAIALAQELKCPVIFTLKTRGLNNVAEIKTEEAEEIQKILDLYKPIFSDIYYADNEHIKDKLVIIAEDEISTGDTANKTGSRLKELGASEIILSATHTVLVSGWRRKLFYKNPFYKVIAGDTIPRGYENSTGGKIHEISLAEPITKELFTAMQDYLARNKK